MKLPSVAEPQRYEGLYVYDFGAWTAMGYTAAEIAVLLEDRQYQNGTIYKIHRASPDGGMELRGVSADRWQLECGMFFYRADVDEARRDFSALCAAAMRQAPPCRAYVHLADRGSDSGRARYLTAMLFPSEYVDEVSDWLTDIGFAGGDVVEGGISCATNYYEEAKNILDRQQLWSQSSNSARTPHQILTSVRQALQR